MKKALSQFVLIGASVFGASQLAQAAVLIPFGSSTGTLAVHYNSASPEAPANQDYSTTQNTHTNLNGSTFNFDAVNDLSPLPGVQSMAAIFQAVPNQFGFDMTIPAPTTNGGPYPFVTAKDNVNGNPASSTSAGSVVWGLSGYQGGSTAGPAVGINAIVNTLFRSNNSDPVTLDFNSYTSTTDGFDVTIGGYLNSDGTIYWYTPSTANSSMAAFFNDGVNYASGRIRFDGTLHYITANDTTPGIDYYDGTITYQLELVPTPATTSLIGLAGLVTLSRRRR